MSSTGDAGTDRDPEAALTTVPAGAALWVRLVLAFGVSVAIGLAPFLGKTRIPGFSPLLDFFPVALQNIAIPLSSFLMGVVAVGVQFYAGANLSSGSIARWFPRTGAVLILLFLGLIVAYFLSVSRVGIDGDARAVAFVIGYGARPPQCDARCPASLSDSACIKVLSFDPTEIASCYGERTVNAASLVLVLLYLAVTSAFGVLVGLLTLRDGQAAHPDRHSGR